LDEDMDEEEAIVRLKEKLGIPELKEENEEHLRLGPVFKGNTEESDEEDGEEEDSEEESKENGGDNEEEQSEEESEKEDEDYPKDNNINEEKNDKKKNGIKRQHRMIEIEDESEDNVVEMKKEKSKFLDNNDDFEVVPMQKFEENEESTDESELEDEEKFYGLALSTMMVRDRKFRRNLIDDSYNRYAFNDVDLPKWFKDDEEKHNKPQLPITKEIVKELKMKTRELNARPIKKVAEAKARKKMKAMKKLDKLKQTTQTIADSTDLTPSEKTRQIEGLYKKQAKLSKFNNRAKTYVVTRKGGSTKKVETGKKSVGRIKVVDKRMKKDARNTKFQAKKAGKRGQKRKR